MPHHKHLFGPVPSRRFGRSLGLDMVPHKTCSYDCVFCQLGRTTVKTVERRDYVPVGQLLGEFGDWIEDGGDSDYVTLAGSGEPTLHAHFGDVIDAIRGMTGIPVLLLTNGSLFHDPEVRRAACGASVVKASLSVWDDASLQRINRPHMSITFDKLLAGLRQFGEEFEGDLFIEVFVVPGMNDSVDAVQRIAGKLASIDADRVQLNTAVRPPAEPSVKAVPRDQMHQLAAWLGPHADVVADYQHAPVGRIACSEQGILDMVTRRPCSADHIADAFSMHRNEVAKYLGRLVASGRIEAHRHHGTVFYHPRRTKDNPEIRVDTDRRE